MTGTTTITEVGPLVDTSQGETLAEMVNQVVGLRNIQRMWREKQLATDPLYLKWHEYEDNIVAAFKSEIDYLIDLFSAMRRQGVDFVDAGRFYAAMACLTGHPGSLYAHVGEAQQ